MKYAFLVFYGSFYYSLVILWRADLMWKETDVFLGKQRHTISQLGTDHLTCRGGRDIFYF